MSTATKLTDDQQSGETEKLLPINDLEQQEAQEAAATLSNTKENSDYGSISAKEEQQEVTTATRNNERLLKTTTNNKVISSSSIISNNNSTTTTVREGGGLTGGPLPMDIKSRLIAEIVGTCFFVQMGMAANCVSLYMIHHKSRGKKHMLENVVMSSLLGGGIRHDKQIWVAFVWGLSLMIALYLVAPYSGGHLNPAVTFSYTVARSNGNTENTDNVVIHYWNNKLLVPYMISQVVGAMIASFVNLLLFYQAIHMFEDNYNIHRGTTDSSASAAAFIDYWRFSYIFHKSHVTESIFSDNNVHVGIIEGFGTAVFVFVIFVLTSPRNPIRSIFIPPLIGLTYSLLLLTLGPLTGGSFNPARDLGPRFVIMVAGWGPVVAMTNCIPYLIGPFIGGPIGAFFADRILLLR